MRKFVLVFAALAAAFFIGYAVNTADKPHCPTEDSCSLDFRSGEWHITETTP